LEELTRRLAAGQSLSEAEVQEAVQWLVDEAFPVAAKADFLGALTRKGETPEEIAAFARALRARAVTPPLDPAWRASRQILDVVGTGGDRLSTFNISTTAALLAAAAGVAVAKHGNRAVTSAVGSADVMEALGLPFELDSAAAARALRERGFAFFFAPRYHPAFRHIAPARKLCAERGERTIFNFLGPLLNPARPTAALIGVPRPELCAPIARVLQSLGVQRAMVVCGAVPLADGGVGHLDELSTLGPSTVAALTPEQGLQCTQLDPAALPLQPATLADLRGGDPARNATIIRDILRGADRGPRRDAALLNAGAALFVAGVAGSVAEGWARAAALIEAGQAWRKFQELCRP